VVVDYMLFDDLDRRNRALRNVRHLGRVMVDGRIDGDEMVRIMRHRWDGVL
jgi:hypothetical protein